MFLFTSVNAYLFYTVFLSQELQEQLEAAKQSNSEKDKRVEELTDYIGKAAADREQIIHTYTSYGQQVCAFLHLSSFMTY